MELPSNKGTNFIQKIVSFGLIGGVALGAMSIFNNYIAPNLIWFLKNVWAIALLGTPILLISLYVIFNPLVVWGFFKTLGSKFTSMLIKMDVISTMRRYVEFLEKKKLNLDEKKGIIAGKKAKLESKLSEFDQRIKEATKYGSAALQQNDSANAEIYGDKLISLRESVQMLTPIYQQSVSVLNFLDKLSTNWGTSIVKLTNQVDIMEERYNILKDTVGALGSAEEYINSGTEAGKLYGESLKAFEESVSQKIGFITEFEKKADPIMKQLALEKSANSAEGLKALQAILDEEKLSLPTEFESKKTINITTKKEKINKFNI